MNSAEVRGQLVDALQLDLVGPAVQLGNPAEVLPQAPSRWYLTGFLVPLGAESEQRTDEASTEEMDQPGESGGLDDDVPPESAAAKRRYMPSSAGLSVLVPGDAQHLQVAVSWGDYHLRSENPEQWERKPRTETLTIDLSKATEKAREKEVPESSGLFVAYLARPVGAAATDAGLPAGARTVSVFLVNRRTPAPDEKRDEAFAFQVEIKVACDLPFLPRPDLRSLASADWDECLADLQYCNEGEYAVGHNVATEAFLEGDACRVVRSRWVPRAEVERVAPAKIAGVELSMDALSNLKDGAEASTALSGLVSEYRKWIEGQRANIPASPAKRRETGIELLNRAVVAARRIQSGIDLLADPACLEAFKLANKTMADAARQRQGVMQKKPKSSVKPEWRPFQLAFLLMNLPGIAEPEKPERQVVDLLFFPTGGAKD